MYVRPLFHYSSLSLFASAPLYCSILFYLRLQCNFLSSLFCIIWWFVCWSSRCAHTETYRHYALYIIGAVKLVRKVGLYNTIKENFHRMNRMQREREKLVEIKIECTEWMIGFVCVSFWCWRWWAVFWASTKALTIPMHICCICGAMCKLKIKMKQFGIIECPHQNTYGVCWRNVGKCISVFIFGQTLARFFYTWWTSAFGAIIFKYIYIQTKRDRKKFTAVNTLRKSEKERERENE